MRKLLIVLSLAIVTFAGCGGGDDDGGSAKDTDAASESADGSTATTEADTDFSGKGSGDFCELAKKYEEDFNDTGGSSATADVKKEYQELGDAIDKLVSEAPAEIKADTQKVNGAFKKLNALLEKYDYDFTKIPESEADDVKLDDPEIEAASNRVEAYFEKVCGIDSDDDGDTDGVNDDTSTSGEEQAPAETTETTEE
jgi:hypothetical protein